MRLGERLQRATPWGYITVVGLATLSLVDLWRNHGPHVALLARGVLPNLVAVPTLAFGFLMMRYPEQQAFMEASWRAQTREFWRLWTLMLVVVIAWEFIQRVGALVFDPLDLVVTVVGAVIALPLFFSLRKRTFSLT
ncbi:MAG: hypothetical protein RhofKO_20740 [Rhodothermales bacterium]